MDRCLVHGVILDDDAGLVRAPLASLLTLADPLEQDPWGVGVITVDDVISHSTEHPASGSDHACVGGPDAFCRGCEIARIAHLVLSGWPAAAEDRHPITVDVGVADYLPDWPILDGNHRVAAATVRGDRWVDLVVAGDWDRAVSLLVHGRPLDETLDGASPEQAPGSIAA